MSWRDADVVQGPAVTLALEQIEFVLRGQPARTAALVYPSEAKARAAIILAPGAGSSHDHPWMAAMARRLATRGFAVVTFNFLYRELGRGAPDKKEVLEATWLAAIAAVRAQTGKLPLYIGGKSMGGRIASQVAADPKLEVDGLVLLGYPLHPPDKPEQLRTAHLKDVRAPMLFVQGERDPFGSPDELRPFLEGTSKGTRLFPIKSGDHSLATTKKSGSTTEQTMERIADEIAAFAGLAAQ